MTDGMKNKGSKNMTSKAKAVLRSLQNAKYRNQILGNFNRENLDQVDQVGGDKADKILSDMNALEAEVDQHIQEIGPKVTVY